MTPTEMHIQALMDKIDKLEAEIKKNEKRLLKLEALEQIGVDNWNGYGEAMELYREWVAE